jgi:hypothetical protein
VETAARLCADPSSRSSAHSLTGLLCKLELNGTACLPLHDRGLGSHSPTEGHIINPESNEVTSSHLAVEGQVEQGQIPDAMSDLEPEPNGPDLFSFERRFGANQLALIPRRRGSAGMVGDLVLHCSAPERSPRNETWPSCRQNRDGYFS